MSAERKLIGAADGSAADVDPYFNNVSLLLHGDGTNGAQNNTFLDSSTNNFTIYRNGNTTQGTFSPFNTTTPYNPAVNGGSGYFGGNYLSVADKAAFNLLTNNFTYETWFYPTYANPADYGTLIGNRATTGDYGEFALAIASNGKMGVFVGDGWGIIASNASIAPYTLNAWNHCVLVRSGTSVSFFLNGVRYIAATSSASISNTGAAWTIGAGSANGGQPFYGYITNSRLVIGTAVYDPTQTTYTVPTSPLTAISGTSLLLNFTNAGIYDNAAKNDLETVGNAQVSTAVKKYGTGSMAFDGTGDWLFIPTNVNLDMGGGDFTWEFWINPNSVVSSAYILAQQAQNTTIQFSGGINSDQLVVYDGTTRVIGAVSTSVWTHVALVRASGALKVYLNGVATGASWSNTSSTSFTLSGGLIGSRWGGTNNLNGYIDDLRITKGVARYTANFTPPTAAFPNQ